MKELLLYLSVVAGFITPIIGVVAVLKGTFRPQRMSQFLLLIISLLFVGTLWAQGDTHSVWIACAQLVGSMAVFGLSLKWGMGGTSAFDFFILFLTTLSLLVWQATSDPTYGLLLSIATDFIAFSPTLLKAWQYPETEEWRYYMSDVVASGLSLLSLTIYSLEVVAFPLYLFLINAASVVLIVGRGRLCGVGK